MVPFSLQSPWRTGLVTLVEDEVDASGGKGFHSGAVALGQNRSSARSASALSLQGLLQRARYWLGLCVQRFSSWAEMPPHRMLWYLYFHLLHENV